ncbi:MAG: 4-hydroxyphenylacetate 3-hydroxylase C-terminal domain-containing protein [Bilophila wadsworthia]
MAVRPATPASWKPQGGRGQRNYGGQEVIIIFEDTFVPYKNVYMLGEIDFTGMLVERFAGYHRQSYGGCKVGNGDVLIGASQTAAECNGCAKASHIKDKIIEMIHLNETLFSCGIACSCEGSPTRAGNYQIDMLLANVCKQNVTRLPYEIARLAQDIAGGLMVTHAFRCRFHVRRSGRMVPQAMVGDARYSVEDRQRILRLIEAMTIGSVAVGYLTESMHGAGSPQAQRIMIGRQANMEAKKALHAACAASIPTACSDLKTPATAFGALAGHCLKRGKGVSTRTSFLRKRTAWLTSR